MGSVFWDPFSSSKGRKLADAKHPRAEDLCKQLVVLREFRNSRGPEMVYYDPF